MVCAWVLALTTSSASALATIGFFTTPSGKIACQWTIWRVPGIPFASIQCGVSTGFKPPLAGHADCKYPSNSGERVVLLFKGRSELTTCATDSGPFGDVPNTPILRNGKTWGAEGIACTESPVGLTCRNRDGHGFFLSPSRWRVF
jgi:hypothetical protein